MMPLAQALAPAVATSVRDVERSTALASAIYTGEVRHRRHAPHAHAFRYHMAMLYLDLAEIETVFAERWLWSVDRRNLAEFRRSDYLGDATTSLDAAVRERAKAVLGRSPAGPIRLLTHLRYFGYCFNPVSFYYCYAADGITLDVIVAEITNTPWRERHAYVLPVERAERDGSALVWQFTKAFHVSPFMAMRHDYRWRLQVPGERLGIHMDVLDCDDPERREFDATLSLRRRPLDGRGLAGVLLRYPLMTTRVISAIHWQALRLWLRGNPVHTHPDKRT